MKFNNKVRLVWLCSYNIGPYFYFSFKALKKNFGDFVVVRIKSEKSQPRPWSNDLLSSVDWIMVDIAERDIYSLIKILWRTNPDIIFIAGNTTPYLLSVLWAKIRQKPCVMVSDTAFERYRSGIKRLIKSQAINLLYDAIFTTGTIAKRYRISQGIPEQKIWTGLYVTDNQRFCREMNFDGNLVNIPSTPFFLFVGRLSREKNVDSLIKAYNNYKKGGGSWKLVISGSGPLESELKSLVPEEYKDDIYFTGWTGYDRLPYLYKSASCFILPSIFEPWGVVVNEAMAAGLPILISKNCGCVEDLCVEGVNGFSFDPMNIDEITGLMFRISSTNTSNLRKMGDESRRIIQDYTPEKWAEKVMDIYQSLCK